jgi:hypothetical protein
MFIRNWISGYAGMSELSFGARVSDTTHLSPRLFGCHAAARSAVAAIARRRREPHARFQQSSDDRRRALHDKNRTSLDFHLAMPSMTAVGMHHPLIWRPTRASAINALNASSAALAVLA